MTAQKTYVPVMPSNVPLYDRDFYAWSNEQAALLRAGRFADADMANIAEEIESMGRSEKRELIERLTVLLAHLLKWDIQKRLRSKSWEHTIDEQRARIADHLEDNPSLEPQMAACMAKAFKGALVDTMAQTGLDPKFLPDKNQWQVDEIMRDGWFPGHSQA